MRTASSSGRRTPGQGFFRLAVPAICLFLCGRSLRAQDLDPRAYAVTPLGTNIAAFVYSHLSGDVLFDPALPLDDVRASFNIWAAGYYRSIDLFGRSANVRIAVPYLTGNVEGLVFDTFTSVDKRGFADLRGQVSVNLLGAPALSRSEFSLYRPATALFASFTVLAPTGAYDSSKLVNIGNHRWAFKPEVALVQPLGKWTLEGYAGCWIFTTNDDFFGGHERAQDPMLSFQGHVSYTFRPGLWAAADATLYTGGNTTLDGVSKSDRQSASRAGVAGSWAFLRGHAVKLQYTRTTSVRIGGKFNFLSFAYTYTWFDR